MIWRSMSSIRILAFLQVPLIVIAGFVMYELWDYSSQLKHEVQKEIEEVQSRDRQIQQNIKTIHAQAHTITSQYQKLHAVAGDLLDISVQATHACSAITEAAARLSVKDNPDASALESCEELAGRLDQVKSELNSLPKL